MKDQKTMTQEILNSVEQFIKSEMFKHLQKQNVFDVEHHNHPPLRFLVDDCPYCKKHGNIYCK